MFGIFTGVIVNALLIIAGTAAGCLFKGDMLRQVGDRIFQAFSFFVIVLGISGAIALKSPIFTLISLVIGITAGELLDLDGRFEKAGLWLQNKFARRAEGDNSRFAEGFVQASLLFCIGSMTIMGALQAGLENEHSIYYTKGLIDGVSAMTFAMGAGIGTGFSAIAVIIYQGLLVGASSLLGGVLTEDIIALSTQIGSLSLIAIGFNLLGLTKIKVANFLPAMFVPMIYQAILMLIRGI